MADNGESNQIVDVEGLLTAFEKDGINFFFDHPDVRSFCLIGLNECGLKPPFNHLALFTIKHGLKAATHFGGREFRERLVRFLQNHQTVGPFLSKLAGFCREEKDKQKLAVLLRADLAKRNCTIDIAGDEATEMEVLVALHNQQALAGLAEDQEEFFNALKTDIGTLYSKLTQITLDWQDQGTGEKSAVASIKYDSGVYAFEGRKTEFDQLGRFLGEPSMTGERHKFRWTLITGAGGEGKTRLAYEYCQRVRPTWDAGKVTKDDLAQICAKPGWRPVRQTLLVIDYPAQFPAEIRRFLDWLDRESRDFDFPVRVLMLEREAQGQWFDTLFARGNGLENLNLHAFSPLQSPEKPGVWPIEPLSSDMIVTIMTARFQSNGLTAPEPDMLLGAARKIDSRGEESTTIPRALFAVATAEIIVRKKREPENLPYDQIIEGLTRENVLAELIARERDQRWKPQADKYDQITLEMHENLLALATFCLGLSRNQMTEALGRSGMADLLPPTHRQATRPLQRDLLQSMGSRNPMVQIDGIEPDILGEFFVLARIKELQKTGDVQAFVNAAFSVGGDQAVIFMLRLYRDYPKAVTSGDLFVNADVTEKGALSFSGLIIDLSNLMGERADWESIDLLFNILGTLRQQFPDNQQIALHEAMAATNVTSDAGEQKLWERVDLALARIDKTRQQFPDDQQIALHEAMAAVNVTIHAGEQKLWERVKKALARIDKTRQQFPGNPQIALHEAMAAVNVTHRAGGQKLWKRVKKALARIDETRKQFPDDQQIALEEAKAATNVTNHAGEQKLWERVEAMKIRIEALVASAQDRPDLQNVCADALCTYYRASVLGNRDIDESTLTMIMQLAMIRNATVTGEQDHRWAEFVLRVINDARTRFSDNDSVCEVVEILTEQGVDWSTIAPL